MRTKGSRPPLDEAEITEQDEAEITPADIEAAREFCARFGTPLLNDLLNAKADTEGTAAMTSHEGYGYKHMHESIVHLFSECPEGSIIAIAKRDTVRTADPVTMQGLELCEWCQAKDGSKPQD